MLRALVGKPRARSILDATAARASSAARAPARRRRVPVASTACGAPFAAHTSLFSRSASLPTPPAMSRTTSKSATLALIESTRRINATQGQ
eukprot:846067-Rhodomonas_salina.2